MSFAQNFAAGQQIAQNALNAYENARRNRDMARIVDAKPEESVGFTAAQGNELRLAAESGQYDIGVKTKDDGTFDQYTITPKTMAQRGISGVDAADVQASDAARPVGTVAMQGVTDFLGNRTAGTMNESQVANARQRAMAGVLMKSDPVQGARMMREVTLGERDDERFAREQRDWATKDKQQAEEEDYKTGLQNEFGNTIFAQQMKDYAPKYQEYIQNKAKYDERVKAGEPAASIGLPPTEPQKPTYSMAQSLADNGRLLAFSASKGKADRAEMMKYAETFKKVTEEGYGQALKLAQSGAPIAKVAEAFNQSGSMKFDPSTVVSDQMVKGQDGVPSRVIKFKDQNGNVQTIPVLADLDALGQAGDVFTRYFQAEGNRRSNEQLQLAKNADGRAGASDKRAADRDTRTQDEAAKLRTAQAGLERAMQSGDSAAINAARLNVIEAGGSVSSGADAIESKFETDPLGGGYVTQKDKRGNMVVTPVDRKGTKGAEVRFTPPGAAGKPAKSIMDDPRAIAIRDDKSLTIEQKRAKLKELGYQ